MKLSIMAKRTPCFSEILPIAGSTGGENPMNLTGKPAFQTLALNIPGIVYRVYVREQNPMEFFNDMLEKVTGYKPGELRRGEVCSIDPMIISDDHLRVIEAVKNAVRESKPFEVEYRITHKNGGIRYFLERGQPIYGSDGKPEFIDGLILDITDRKRSELALNESEERFRSVLDNSLDAIYRRNLKTSEFEYLSPAFVRVTGFTPDELKDMGIEKVLQRVYPDDRHKLGARHDLIDEKRLLEYRFMAKDGKYRWLASNSSVVRDKEGYPLHRVGVIRDITNDKEIENALLFKENIISFSSSVIATCDLEGRMTYGNPSFLKAWGFDHPQEFIGRPFWEFWLVKDRLDEIMRSLRDDGAWFGEIKAIRKDGGIFDVRVSAATVFDSAGNPVALTSTSIDVTERKRVEEDLQRAREDLKRRVEERTAELEKRTRELEAQIAKREQFEKALKGSTEKLAKQLQERKQLAAKLVELLEKDRRDTAMSLHDEVGSILTGARMEIEAIEADLRESPASHRIGKIKERTSEAIKAIRNISGQLRPSSLEHFGLVPSICSLAEQIEKESGIKVAVHAGKMLKRFSPEKELALYRIIQESLTNVLKHAEADEVFVTLTLRDDVVHLSVEDNGKGFNYGDPDTHGFRQVHLGISIMRERALQFGGRFKIETKPGKGTHVLAEVPVDCLNVT
jgi:PAS domain S-box-containing protein